MWSCNKIGYDFLFVVPRSNVIWRSSSFSLMMREHSPSVRLFWWEKFKKKKERERKKGKERKRRREFRAWRRFSRARLSRVSSTLQISLLNTRFILPACFSVNKRAGCELVTLVKDIRASSILGACFKLLHRINAMTMRSLPPLPAELHRCWNWNASWFNLNNCSSSLSLFSLFFLLVAHFLISRVIVWFLRSRWKRCSLLRYNDVALVKYTVEKREIFEAYPDEIIPKWSEEATIIFLNAERETFRYEKKKLNPLNP